MSQQTQAAKPTELMRFEYAKGMPGLGSPVEAEPSRRRQFDRLPQTQLPRESCWMVAPWIHGRELQAHVLGELDRLRCSQLRTAYVNMMVGRADCRFFVALSSPS